MKRYILAAALICLTGCVSSNDARRMRRDGKSTAYGEVQNCVSQRIDALIATGDPLDRLQAVALLQVSADILKLRVKLIDDIVEDK